MEGQAKEYGGLWDIPTLDKSAPILHDESAWRSIQALHDLPYFTRAWVGSVQRRLDPR
jgi:hypothetical protein